MPSLLRDLSTASRMFFRLTLVPLPSSLNQVNRSLLPVTFGNEVAHAKERERGGGDETKGKRRAGFVLWTPWPTVVLPGTARR